MAKTLLAIVRSMMPNDVFIIQKLAKDTPYLETAKGVMPFLASDFVRIGLLLAFPAISLFLVRGGA